MERDDGKPTAGREQLLGRHKPAMEFAEFVVYRDPQRLEGPRRGILPRLRSRYGCSHNCRQLGRAPNAAALPLRRDRAGDAACKMLFAEGADQLSELGLGKSCDEIGRAPALAAHPHIERPVEAEREPALRGIELDRRDAEVECDAGDRICIHRRQKMRHIAEPALDYRQTRAMPFGDGAAMPYRLRVAIDGKDAATSGSE